MGKITFVECTAIRTIDFVSEKRAESGGKKNIKKVEQKSYFTTKVLNYSNNFTGTIKNVKSYLNPLYRVFLLNSINLKKI